MFFLMFISNEPHTRWAASRLPTRAAAGFRNKKAPTLIAAYTELAEARGTKALN